MASNLTALLANTSENYGPQQTYTPEQFIQAAESSGFQPAGAAVITAIGERESGGPGSNGILSDFAVNPQSGATGTLQFLPAAWPQLTAGGASSCAAHAPCALTAAFDASGGTNYAPWDVTQDMEPAGETAYGDWEDSQAQRNLANYAIPAIQALGQDTPAFRQQLAALTPRTGGSGGPAVGSSGSGTFVGNTNSGNPLNSAVSGVFGDLVSSLQSAYGQPFERVGIFVLGVVAVLGGLLLLSGGRGGTTIVKVAGRAAAA